MTLHQRINGGKTIEKYSNIDHIVKLYGACYKKLVYYKKCFQQNLARVVSLSRELKELHQSCMIVPSSPKNHKSPPFLTFFHQYNSYRFVPMDNSIDSMPECLQMTYCKKNVSKYCPIPSFAYKYRCIKVLNITLV